MTQITSERIHELIEKSRLVDPTALNAAFEEIKGRNGGVLPEDPVELCKELEAKGLVTRWQCEKFLQGKYKGFILGKHKLLGHLGSGGMSSVYLAEHLMMRHKRAIKVLPKSKLGNSSYLERFQREAKAIASLNHPNIVKAFDIDNDRDTHYIVMEYVEGADMQTLVRKHGPLPFDLAADYIAQAARGLQHAHELGLIHRDVKPANILIDKNGIVKVLDLGLALFAEDKDASLTMEYNDKVLGTADYLAPEQAINSHSVDSRADMYGLGCTFYYLLTGHPPFPDGSIASRIIKHQNSMPANIRKDRPDCPGELDGVCVKMMQKDPRFRYANCQQVADVLQAWLDKYRKETAASGKNPPQVSVSDILADSKKKSGHDAETVSNRGAKTMGGKVDKNGLVSLSASDSGVLRAIAKSDGSTVDSKIDLIHDSNKPNPKRSKSQAIDSATNTIASKSDSKSSPLLKPLATTPTVPTPKPPSPPQITVPKKPIAAQRTNWNLWTVVAAIVITVLLFVAILVAIFANPTGT